jgi:hypothetical protein
MQNNSAGRVLRFVATILTTLWVVRDECVVLLSVIVRRSEEESLTWVGSNLQYGHVCARNMFLPLLVFALAVHPEPAAFSIHTS